MLNWLPKEQALKHGVAAKQRYKTMKEAAIAAEKAALAATEKTGTIESRII